jgi:hypothetical protein
MLEMLLPEYARQMLENYQKLFENYQNMYSQLVSQLRWLQFDDASRLMTRVGYLDDGFIRLRLDGHWEFTGELLRELSWALYSISEIGSNVSGFTGSPGSLPPSRGVVILGYDGEYLRLVRTTPDGKLLAVLG